MGSVNIEPLAQAMFGNQLHPTFDPSKTYAAIWGPAGTTAPLPEYLYMDPGTAGQMASLLGGSLVSGPPTRNIQTANGVIPPGNLIQLPDGSIVLPGDIVGPNGVAWSDLCQVEGALVSEIPGGVVGASCASTGPLYPSDPNNVGTVQTPGSGIPAGQYPANTYVPVAAPVTDVTGGPTSPTATGTPTVNTTPVQSVGTPAPSGDGGNSTGNSTATNTDWSAFLTEASIGSIPNWVWLAGVAALFVFGGKR